MPGGSKPTKPDVTLVPHSLSLAQFATLSQLDICNTNRRKVSINPTISQLLLPTSILLLPFSLSHYKYLLRPWEEAGKPFQFRTENAGETISLINFSLWFPVRSHQYKTEEWVVWCDMSSENDSSITALPLSGAMPACAEIRWWCRASASISVSSWSKLHPCPSAPTWVGFTRTGPPPANRLCTQPGAPPPDVYSCSDTFKMHLNMIWFRLQFKSHIQFMGCCQ